jgi:hypothetical protein
MMIQTFYNIDVKDNDEACHPMPAKCLDRDWYFVKLCNNSEFIAEVQIAVMLPTRMSFALSTKSNFPN